MVFWLTGDHFGKVLVHLADPLAPVFFWEATSVVRRRRYHVVRAAYAAILLLVLCSAFVEVFWRRSSLAPAASLSPYADFATLFFVRLGFVQLIAVLVLTPAYSATTIAVEKQRRTLEHLLLTDTNCFTIVIGKWCARSLNALMLILAGIPVASVAMLLGGVGFAELLAVTTITAMSLLATTALSVFVSANTKHVRDAILGSYTLLVLLLLSPLLVNGLGGAGLRLVDRFAIRLPLRPAVESSLRAVEDLLSSAEPFHVYQTVITRGGWADETTLAMGIQAAVTILCLGLAVCRLRPAYLAGLATAGRRQARRGPVTRRRRTVPPVFERPMVWKEWYFDLQRSASPRAMLMVGVLLWATLFLPFLLHFYWYLRFGDFGPLDAVSLNRILRMGGTGFIGITLIMVAVRSASAIGIERDRDCWPSLLYSPLTAEEIIFGKIVGAMKPIFWLLLFFLPGWLLAILCGALSPLAPPVLATAMLVYAFSIAALGVWQSLRCATVTRAMSLALAVALLACVAIELFGGLLLAPILFFCSERTAELLSALAFPGTLLILAAFRAEELAGNSMLYGHAPTALLAGGFYLLVFALLGMWMVFLAIEAFPRGSGRTDAGHERSLPESEIRGLAAARTHDLVRAAQSAWRPLPDERSPRHRTRTGADA